MKMDLTASDNGQSESFGQVNEREAIARANAKTLLQIYRTREKRFPGGNFSDPGWHLLIDLFLQHADGKAVNITGACIGSRAPSTTALRYISDYLDKGLVVRTPSENDHRVSWLSLSAEAQNCLIDLLSVDFR